MGLLDLFNQWIVERGSSIVQEKHLSLFRDQLALADKKSSELESENTVLQSKIKQLESELEKLNRENEILKKIIKTSENNKHNEPLEEIKQNILLFLSNYEQVYPGQVAATLGISTTVAEFHLEELHDANMVDMSCCFGGETSWYLSHEGRKFLVRNNLIT